VERLEPAMVGIAAVGGLADGHHVCEFLSIDWILRLPRRISIHGD
jgi:hypothetical protein